jgi:hypothetical protein
MSNESPTQVLKSWSALEWASAFFCVYGIISFATDSIRFLLA